MSLVRVLGRASRTAVAQCRNFIALSPPPHHHHHQHQFSSLAHHFHSLPNLSRKASASQYGSHCASAFSRCGMSTSAPHEQEEGASPENKGENDNVNTASQASEQTQEADSETDLDDLSKEELTKILFEKEEVLQKKEKEFTEWKDKLLRSYAEMENVMERTKRDAENSKKFAVQSFAKSLLDVADNLSRASSVTKESFCKTDVSGDTVGAVPILKTLLEGVEMTEKQLAEVFRKSGIERYDPTNEQFDPNRHNAVFQVPDNAKAPGTIAVVLKAGYTLHDRVIRPAEVGVTVAVESNENSS